MTSLQTLTFASEDVLTQDQFAEWILQRSGNDINRYELIGGRVVMNPPAGWPEGEDELAVGSLLRVYVVSRGLGRVFGPNQGFELPTGDTLAPDASFISQERWAAAPRPTPGKFLRIVPDLAVEVLSPDRRTRDTVEKRIAYAESGVREYWIVDQRRREVMVFYAASEGRFSSPLTLSEDQTLHSRVVPGLSVIVRDLLVSMEG